MFQEYFLNLKDLKLPVEWGHYVPKNFFGSTWPILSHILVKVLNFYLTLKKKKTPFGHLEKEGKKSPWLIKERKCDCRLFDTSALYQKTQEKNSKPRILCPTKLTFKYKGHKLLSTQWMRIL